MPQTEPNVNYALGTLLQRSMQERSVRSEHTGLLVDRPGQRADNLITGPGVAPVAVEAEFTPAATVLADAASRLGLRVSGEHHPIEAAVALRYPAELADAVDLDSALSSSRLTYALLHQSGDRFPEEGWIEGSPSDLASLISLASTPQQAIDQAADVLQQGIQRAADLLSGIARQRGPMVRAVAEILGMEDSEQTRRMACAVVANAMIFQERLSGMHKEVKPLRLVCGEGVADPKELTLNAWADILRINYWPIFAIAKDIMEQFSSWPAAVLLAELRETAQRFDAIGVNNAHDLTGRIFQRLIADRKFLATFYTRPASAALLANLAVDRMDDADWGDPGAIAKLRVGDFACGTGALLSAVYEQIASRHERKGGASADLHRPMMEDVLYGADVLPSAVHITSATLSGVRPDVGFNLSRIYTARFGRQKDDTVRIGSLELLQSSSLLTLLNTSDPSLRTGSAGEETAAEINAEFPDESYDLVIMNPPYRSNSKHEGAPEGVTHAAFAAFGASVKDQADMSNRLDKFAASAAYHGHAGIGSAFASIAHRKLGAGGVLALVLPFTAINGSSWEKFREMIANHYADITVVSIAANGKSMCFSSDTGIAECLVIARKRDNGTPAATRARFISLWNRPPTRLAASEIARAIKANGPIRRLEDGPYGGSLISVGTSAVGEALDAPLNLQGGGWGAARLRDAAVAQTAYALANGALRLPAAPAAHRLPMIPLGEAGRRGLDSQMFISAAHIGPFIKAGPSPTSTYPALWNHNAENETRIVCQPDAQMLARQGMERRADEVWASAASRVHFNRDFRFNSQALGVAATEAPSIGGRAWPSVHFNDRRFEPALAAWSNSALGLLCYWWHSSRQQDGRGIITVHSLETLPTLDFRALTDEQLTTVEAIFNEFRDKELQPAYLADADPNRALLDRRVLCDMLGFDDDVYLGVRRLAAKWCAEPSVHGGKPRPQGARFVA